MISTPKPIAIMKMQDSMANDQSICLPSERWLCDFLFGIVSGVPTALSDRKRKSGAAVSDR
jgi:hypothetical protein